MLIGKKYKVESDANNLILMIKTVSKKNNTESWRTIGYFYDFRELLKFMADNEIKGTGLPNLQIVSKTQDDIFQLINSLEKVTPESFYQNKGKKPLAEV